MLNDLSALASNCIIEASQQGFLNVNFLVSKTYLNFNKIL